MEKTVRTGLLILSALVYASCNSSSEQARLNYRIDSLQNVIKSHDELFKELQGIDKAIIGLIEAERARIDSISKCLPECELP